MNVILGSVTFDSAHTSFEEKHEEVGGRDERVIVIKGLIAGESTVDAIEARLDEILDAASDSDAEAPLTLRPGRRLLVRRDAFVRSVSQDALCGAFTLTLRAADPFEESIEITDAPWMIDASGDQIAVNTAGNVPSRPVIALTATGDVVDPAISDGVNTIAYAGTVLNGQILVFDAELQLVTLDGADVTPYTSGSFPTIDPDGTTLTFSDDESSAHTASATVSYRDRWW